jgi:hypothetical protein
LIAIRLFVFIRLFMLSCTEEFAATSFQVNRFTLVMKLHHSSETINLTVQKYEIVLIKTNNFPVIFA